jgi:hypothetical protein
VGLTAPRARLVHVLRVGCCEHPRLGFRELGMEPVAYTGLWQGDGVGAKEIKSTWNGSAEES